MLPLLNAVASGESPHRAGTPPRVKKYAQKLLAAFPGAKPAFAPVASAAAVSPAMIEPLSLREREVLRLMAEGLTYAEVAQRMAVSVNTVRFHVKSLYGKLGVARRVPAIDRARALGLL